MKSSSALSVEQHLHLSHLMLVRVLYNRSTNKRFPPAVRREAKAELLRYRDEGLNIQKYGKENQVATTKRTRAHAEPETFTGQGIIFAVIDDREAMRTGRVSTIDVITEAIEAALDAGNETSEDIARYITTSAFQHVTDKRVRFNSILKAGDAVGARMSQKLYNAYNELSTLANDEEDPKKKAAIRAEATGFAEALNIMMSPFSCEDPSDYRLVNWDEVDRITAAFEKEQRMVIKERQGKLH
jgi:hypothetical protein